MLSQIIFNNKKHQTAVILPNGNKFSYGDVQTYSNKINQKINGRCLVFCLSKNHIASLCGYLSFITNRVVPLLLDSSISREFIKQLIVTYKPEYLWIPSNRCNEFLEGEKVYSFLDYTLIKINDRCYFNLNHDLALLLTTSGSTGSPKLVRLSQKNILSNAQSIAQYLEIDSNERPITTLPMHYSFGLSIINSHLLCGSTILLTESTLMQKEFWIFLKNNAATSLSGVPYTFEILKKLRFSRMNILSLTTLTQAGGKLNDDLNKEFSEYCQQSGRLFYVMYGQTEATARMSYLPPKHSLSKLGSMGIAIPGGKFKLVDDNGQEIIEPAIVGELVYEGENVSLGYAESGSDLVKGDENKGTLYTGDLAKRDKDGFFYIAGRKKRFIKLFGNRVNLDETELLLKNIIPECACVGKDDRMLILITDNKLIKKVQNYISLKTGINSKAFKVTAVEKIPKNSSGKTVYSQLFD